MAERTLQSPNFSSKDLPPRMGRRSQLMADDDDGSASPLNLISNSLASSIASRAEVKSQIEVEEEVDVNEAEVPDKTEITPESSPKLDASEAAVTVPQPTKSYIVSEKSEAEVVQLEPVEAAASVKEVVPTTEEQKPVGEPSSVLKRARVKLDSLKDGKQATVIPWKQKQMKVTTVAEEKRKLFANFDKTSVGPPDTPLISETKLKKVVSKAKTRNDTFKKPNIKKDLYAFVSPKVNTRWNKMGALDEWKQMGRPTGLAVYPVALSAGPRGSNRTVVGNKSASALAGSSRPMGGSGPFNVNSKQRVPNRFPLTIPPHRLKSPKHVNIRATGISAVTRRMYNKALTPIQRYKNEILKQQQQMEELARSPTTPYKSPVFNLHRINNAGMIGRSKQQQQWPASQTIRPTQSHLITAAARRQFTPAPAVQMIQAPPSPFLASQVSVPNQLMEIPINGEITRTAAKTKPAGGPVTTNVRPSPSNNKSKKSGGKGAAGQNTDKSKNKAPPAPKVYNKIYIGPYSGSESEGEQKAAPKALAKKNSAHQSTKKKALKK